MNSEYDLKHCVMYDEVFRFHITKDNIVGLVCGHLSLLLH